MRSQISRAPSTSCVTITDVACRFLAMVRDQSLHAGRVHGSSPSPARRRGVSPDVRRSRAPGPTRLRIPPDSSTGEFVDDWSRPEVHVLQGPYDTAPDVSRAEAAERRPREGQRPRSRRTVMESKRAARSGRRIRSSAGSDRLTGRGARKTGLAVDAHVAAIGFDQPNGGLEEDALPAARRADDPEGLAESHGEVDAGQDGDIEALVDVSVLDHWRAAATSA